MDVHLLDVEPTSAERDALDAFLGPPLTSWVGADRADDGHAAHGGQSAREQRHQMLPALHALHEQAGWISPGALNYIARRLTIPPPTYTGSPRSMRCSRSSRGRPACCMSATIWCAGAPARNR